MKEKNSKRSTFSGKLGFILTAAGAAVGLGNIWRFPYLAAKYGGGIFLAVYIALALSFGFFLMIAEIAIGRKTSLSAIGAFSALDRRFSFLGYLASAIPFIILPYYSVIGGWVTKYTFEFIRLRGTDMASDGFYDSFISSAEPLLWFVLFAAISAVIVLCGVNGGIERMNKFMMPLLVILTLFISSYNLFYLDGAIEGVKYYLIPDVSRFSFMTVVAATGQLFYSMSLAMGTMITFGSYMKKDISIPSAAHRIEFFDLGVAFLCGLLVIPSVYAFSGGDSAALGEGSGLIFITLPKIFTAIPSGNVIGIAFFITVLFAALTSSVSLMETIVSVITDRLGIKRQAAALAVFILVLLLGTPISLGYGIWDNVKIFGLYLLDFFDFLGNNIMMPIVALISCIFIGFVIKPKAIVDELRVGGNFKAVRAFELTVKFFAPVCLIIILVSSVLSIMGIISI